MTIDYLRKLALANYFSAQSPEVREAFILGQIYFQAGMAHDFPENAPDEDLAHLSWLRGYEERTGLRILNPNAETGHNHEQP